MPWRKKQEKLREVNEVYLARAVLEAEIARSEVERTMLELKLQHYLDDQARRTATGNPIGDRLAKRIYPWEGE